MPQSLEPGFPNEVSVTWDFSTNRFLEGAPRRRELARLLGHPVARWRLKLLSDLAGGAFDNRRRPDQVNNDQLLIAFKQDPVAAVSALGREPDFLEFDFRLRRPRIEGSRFLLKAKLIRREDGEPELMRVRIQDITSPMERAVEGWKRARRDPLTGLLRKEMFAQAVEDTAAEASASGRQVALAVIDLREFKKLNDAHGHDAGDVGLSRFGARLLRLSWRDLTIARTGGDEFKAVATVADEAELEAFAAAIAKERSVRFQARDKEGHRRVITLSADVGVALVPRGMSEREASRRADTAMYHAKRHRLPFAVYSRPLGEEFSRQYEMEQAIRAAVVEGEIPVSYLPYVGMQSGRYVGVEALTATSARELVGGQPLECLMQIINELELLEEFTFAQIRRVCREMMLLRTCFPDAGLWAAVNIAPSVLCRCPNLAKEIASVLDDTGLPASALHLEMTESEQMPRASVENVLRELQELGLVLVIDDFGKGHANVDRVLSHPECTTIKLDMLLAKPKRRQLAAFIVPMLQSLEREVVVEGISSLDQFRYFQSLGVQLAQGYFLGGLTRHGEGKYSFEDLQALLFATRPDGYTCGAVESLNLPAISA